MPTLPAWLKDRPAMMASLAGLFCVAAIAGLRQAAASPALAPMLLLAATGVTTWLAGRIPALLALLSGTSFGLLQGWLLSEGAMPGEALLLGWFGYGGGGLGAIWIIGRWRQSLTRLEQRVTELSSELRQREEKHQETERWLRESLERYYQLAENISEVFWLSDPEHKQILYISPGYEKIWGRTCESIYAERESWLEAIHPDDKPRVTQALARQDQGYDVAYRIMRPDGALRWIRDRAFPVRDAQGRVNRIAGIAEDITAQEQTNALLELQRDVNRVLSTLGDLPAALNYLLKIVAQLEGVDSGGVYLVDQPTGELNLAAHRGLTPEFIAQVNHYGSDTPQAKFVNEGKPHYAQTPALPPGIGVACVAEGLCSLGVVPMRDENRTIAVLNVASHTCREIPYQTRVVLEAIAAQAHGAIKRIQAEEARRNAEARLRALVAGAPIILFAGDREGTITFAEGQALSRLGARTGGYMGRSVLEFFGNTPAVVDSVRRVLDGEPVSSIVKVKEVAFDCRYSPFRAHHGLVTGFIGVATDITEQLRLEDQILTVSDFAQARIGHDLHDGLCQHLVGIMFDANALLRQLRDHQSPETARAERMVRMLDEAITESRRLARGLYPVRLEVDGLASALEELAAATRDRFGLECDVQYPPNLAVPNHTTATHLYRIAQEAVNNAVKHSGGSRVWIRLVTDDSKLCLEVADNGRGIDKPPSAPPGMGMHIMDYRARSLEGVLKTVRSPGAGTTVSCCVSLTKL